MESSLVVLGGKVARIWDDSLRWGNWMRRYAGSEYGRRSFRIGRSVAPDKGWLKAWESVLDSMMRSSCGALCKKRLE
jgi:hypothetical protein